MRRIIAVIFIALFSLHERRGDKMRQPWQLKFRTHIPRLGKRKALNI